MDLNKVLETVRALVNKAEHPGTEPQEAKIYREKADALMLKYAIDEISADHTRPASLHQKPSIITIGVGGNSDITGYVATLAQYVAAYCRCRIRHYTGYNSRDMQYESKVYGFESDLRYFEILYTTLRLHMLGAISPEPDPDKSVEENAYTLHNAGFNWYDIAKIYGWRETGLQPGDTAKHMYLNRKTGERLPWSKAVGVYERAYKRAIQRRGEKPLRIPPRGMETFRKSAAQGYNARIWQRLREVQSGRTTGTELLLRSRIEDISDLFMKDNPDLFKEQEQEKSAKPGRSRKYVPPPFSEAGYRAGTAHANTASLNPEATARKTGELHD